MLDVKLLIVIMEDISVGFGYHKCSDLETAGHDFNWDAIIAVVGIISFLMDMNLLDILESIDP